MAARTMESTDPTAARPAADPTAADDAAIDRDLVARARTGDLGAYDDLIRRHQDRIYGLVYHMTSHHEDAADLAQEAFVKGWKALKSFKGDASFYTWIYRIAVNTTLNHLKQRRNRTPHFSLNDVDRGAENDAELVQLISEHTPLRDAGLHELGERLNAALHQLSEQHRMVVVLHDIQGLPHDEIARIAGCNAGTVRSRLFYARQQLQGLLADLVQ